MYAVMFRYKKSPRWSFVFADPDSFKPEEYETVTPEEYDQHQYNLQDMGVFTLQQANKLFVELILDCDPNNEADDEFKLSEIKISKINHWPPHNESEVIQYREFK